VQPPTCSRVVPRHLHLHGTPLTPPHLSPQVFGALCQSLSQAGLLLRSHANLETGRRELNCWYCCYAESDASTQQDAATATLLLRRIAAREELLPLQLAPTAAAHRPSTGAECN
jgi:hypothetical protein